MEVSGNVSTAQDLFELLKQIPEAQRERLPIQGIFMNEDGTDQDSDQVYVNAYETTETEGCIARGLQITIGDI